MQECKVQHCSQVIGITGCHDHHVGKDPHVADVKGPMMRRTVGCRQTGTIQHEGNRQILQADFLEDLVVAPLQERAVNVNDWSEASLGLATGKRNGV